MRVMQGLYEGLCHILEVPIIRTIVFGVLYWGSLILGNEEGFGMQNQMHSVARQFSCKVTLANDCLRVHAEIEVPTCGCRKIGGAILEGPNYSMCGSMLYWSPPILGDYHLDL